MEGGGRLAGNVLGMTVRQNRRVKASRSRSRGWLRASSEEERSSRVIEKFVKKIPRSAGEGIWEGFLLGKKPGKIPGRSAVQKK